ncbi:MAG: hypothetical protein J6X86_04190 [Bacteroidales bacterium]|nr:hypothetical protein [Bacteroidales bacterium]
MIPGNSELLKCPFCGEEKEVLTLLSGNTCNGQQWSDMKSIYPMLPKVSPIQKCPSCGKYYFTKDAEKRQGKAYSLEKGDLTYTQLKEAAVQFGDEISKEDRFVLDLLLLWAYNDLYNREDVNITDAPAEEKAYIDTVLDRLVEREDIDNIMKAEFYREMGLFVYVPLLISQLNIEDPFLRDVAKRIHDYAKCKKSIAFKI